MLNQAAHYTCFYTVETIHLMAYSCTISLRSAIEAQVADCAALPPYFKTYLHCKRNYR